MSVIALNSVALSLGSRLVLVRVSKTVAATERAMVVGPNGAGKPTLLGVVAGTVQPDSGSAISVGMDISLPDANSFGGSVQSYLHEALAPLRSLSERFEELSAALIAGAEGLDAQFDETLSPGQRARVGLATLLILKPEALILDEPTNHLDAAALSFLTHTVTNWPGPALMASHDRWNGRRLELVAPDVRGASHPQT
ncbi:ATP-binding cassette domain-containing protein [Corynebacterium uterequi]|uniref:ABC transporter n=1 Tax=Corynebacterium uterequi TaxID=1072256 RepID=A0A0G3HJ52_9CORY|nr:ATP-binding cassette domain-containing protein [Corynebacterium uterequi]AKK11132.1 ABC transporter [Corynebacterium uterequi]